MSTHDSLFVGIDVSKDSNHVYMMNFNQDKLKEFSSVNNDIGAKLIEDEILKVINKNNLNNLIVVLESTGIYSAHIATFLSASYELSAFGILVYSINPKISKNYRASFSDMDKTDPKDSFVLADLARVGRTKSLTPFKGAQKLALQRLTRHRFHLSEQLSREKTYILTNVFLKFSEFGKDNIEGNNLSNNFGKTSVAILEEFKSTEDIISTSIEDLADFISKKSKNRVADSTLLAKVIKKSARDSYRLDKCAYDPINFAISSSLNCIRCFEAELKHIDKAIANQVKGLNKNEYQSLISIPGVGPVFAAGILSEIGSIKQFHSDAALSKYAGITWRKNQSGKFNSDNTPMTKTGNKYLRYYLIEATNRARRSETSLNIYYKKKYSESTAHYHKRALALTARKFIRLVYGLMSRDQLYNPNN